MQRGASERASEASQVTGSSQSQVQVEGSNVDLDRFVEKETTAPAEQDKDTAQSQETNNGSAADSAAARRARLEAERKAREAALNEEQHRRNDARIAKAAQESQADREPLQPARAATMAPANDTVANLQARIENEGITISPTGEMHDGQGRIIDDQLRDQIQQNANELEFVNDPNDFEYEYDNGQFMSARPKRASQRAAKAVTDNDAVEAVVDNATGKKPPKLKRKNIGGRERQGNPKDAQSVAQQVVTSTTNIPAQEDQVDTRAEVDRYINDYNEYRHNEARSSVRAGYEAWKRKGNKGGFSDYVASPEFEDDPEAFLFALKSLMNEDYVGIDDTEIDDQNNEVPRPDTGIGIDKKENKKQNRLIDNVTKAFKLGFFHVTTEHVDEDSKTGERFLRWSKPVETRIVRLCDYFGMDRHAIDSHRTVFRLVLLYGSIGYDRNGKMFGEGKDEWSMTEDEFCDICDMIYQSCIECGHPLAAPFNTSIGESKLRGTTIVPSGVMPKVVAKAITGPNSQLKMSAGELIRACRAEWVGRTYPWVKRNLVNKTQRTSKEQQDRNLVAQRIAIEDMQQALARLDGMDAEAFSERFGVDTTLHYKLEEYRNTNVNYIQAMNGMYDAEAVVDFQNAQLEEIERQVETNKKNRQVGAVGAAANIVTAGIKTNALFWNVPIALSAVAEKGIGDLQTDLAIKSIASRTERKTGSSRMDVSQLLKDAFKTEEAHQAIDAALIIMDIGGPQALALFGKEGQPLTKENASKFIQEKLAPDPKTSKAATVQRFNNWLSKTQQKILTGDIAFKNKDAMNYLNALLTSNQVLIGAQEQLAESGRMDTRSGLALTGAELDDIFLANNGDVTRFLTEVLTTPAGRDSLIMMRSNNIGNFNPVGYAVDKVLRDHAVTNALVTTFFDSFPKYGINFLYSVTPFSRSLTYLEMKRREAGGDITAGMMTMGGSLSDVSNVESLSEAMKDPAFQAGLRMNVMYDAMAIGRWAATAAIIGGILAVLGFEPPDKDEDFLNISMWKIGGEEIQFAYWLNDLTQLGLPIAYGFAAALSGQDPPTCAKLALSSLYDQVDGNVVMDFIKAVKNWDKELEELDKMGADPSYLSGFSPTYGVMELMLSAGDKITPGAPLYRYLQNNAFFRGDYARAADPNKVYDKSEQWAIDVGKTDYVVDPTERQMRRHSTSNWMLAAYQDWVNGILFNPDSEKTGYFWWEMPPKTKADQLVLTWRGQQEMDMDTLEGCKDEASYKELKTDQLLKQIDQVTKEYGGLKQALMNGYFISHDVRYAALDVLSDRLIANELEFQAMKDSGAYVLTDEYKSVFAKELNGYNDFYSALAIKKKIDNEIWDYIKILQNDDVPMWYDGYEQIISDKDITFTHEDGTAALPWEYLISNDVQAEWKLKGNHPWAVLPWTYVDKSSNDIVQRGFSGETVPFWYDEDVTDLENIREGIGKQVVPSGKNAGEVLNDVLFYRNEAGELVHTDKPTIDERAWIPKKAEISDDIKNFDVSDKVKKATEDDDKDNDGNGNGSGSRGRGRYRTSYPRRSYGRWSSSGSGDYNPRIYNTSHNVNYDRAATMYTKTPQTARTTYLRPSFSTKGSREAYKREDF